MADIAIMSMLSESTAIVSVSDGFIFLYKFLSPARKLPFRSITVIYQAQFISASD